MEVPKTCNLALRSGVEIEIHSEGISPFYLANSIRTVHRLTHMGQYLPPFSRQEDDLQEDLQED